MNGRRWLTNWIEVTCSVLDLVGTT